MKKALPQRRELDMLIKVNIQLRYMKNGGMSQKSLTYTRD